MPSIHRSRISVRLIRCLILVVIAGHVGTISVLGADDSQREKAAGPAIQKLHEVLASIRDGVGSLTDDQKARLNDVEISLDVAISGDPTKADDPAFRNSAFATVREILNPDQQSKFDKMIAESKKRANQSKTIANLKQLGLACVLYKNDKGKSAADLGAIGAYEQMSPEVFLCAGSATKQPADWAKMDEKGRADWINKNTDFVYLAGAKAGNGDTDFVVAYIDPEKSKEFNAFLLADGRVVSTPAEKTAAVLQDLKAGKNPAPSMK